MTMRRLDRKRLFEAEKLGKDVLSSIQVGAAMRNSVVSATQNRLGNMIETDIVLDLGTEKASILTGGASATRPIGEDSGAAKLCTISESVFGVVTSVRSYCLELATTDGTAYTNGLDVNIGDNGDGTQGTADTSNPAVVTNMTNIAAAKGKDTLKPYNDFSDISGKSLYIGSPATIGSKSEATATITIDSGDAASFADGSRLVLFDENGDKFEMIIDKTNLAYNATGVPFKIGLLNSDNITKAEEGFKKGIEATNSNFSVSAADSDGTITITANSGTGAEGNNASHGNDNTYVAGSGETETVTVSNFTGGTTEGKTSADAVATFTGGKFLIRITGFVAPDDI